MLTNKKKMIKINMSWGGHIYVEPYHCENNEEENRSKIYDEKGLYLNYINTEFISFEQFNKILTSYKKSKSLENFIVDCLLIESYDYSTDLNRLLYSRYDDADKETFEQLEKDIAKMKEIRLMLGYYVNKIGKWYFCLEY